MKITITVDHLGQYSIQEIVEVPVSAAAMASMRAHGQLDSGKRQRLLPLHNEEGPMVFYGSDAKREAAEAASKFMEGRPDVELVEFDRTIPCL